MQQTLECNKHLESMEIKYEGFIFYKLAEKNVMT